MKKMARIIFALLLLAAAVAFRAKHPFYLGVTDVKYSQKEKALQGSVKLFTNDLEDALRKLYKVNVDLINGQDKATVTTILQDYLYKHLAFKVNGKPVKYTLIGFEHESEALWMYIEGACPVPNSVDIENTLLYDQIKTQINIVHCEVNGVSKSYKVTNPEKNITFSY